MSSIPDDVIPILQSFLGTEDFIQSRTVSRAWNQDHVRLYDLVYWNSPEPVPKCFTRVRLGFKARDSSLKGSKILFLNIMGNKNITDEGFSYLEGIHTLEMSHCNQKEITNNAFSHLKAINTLQMCYCHQITDEALFNLYGIRYLEICHCSFSKETIHRLKNICTLEQNWCNPNPFSSF